MAYIRELPVARSFDINTQGASFDAEFFVWEAANEIEVEAMVFAAAPKFTLNLVRGQLKCKEVGPGMWMCSVNYATLNPQQVIGQDPPPPQTPTTNGALGPQFGFSTVGGTKHIVTSLRTRSMTIPGRLTSTTDDSGAPLLVAAGEIDTANAIGVDGTHVEGCDIADKKFEWTWEQPLKEIPLFYLITLFQLTGRVNYAGKFFGFDKGEVLYLGATGRYSQADQWNITHQFSCRPNERNVEVGRARTGNTGLMIPFIGGWEHVWFEYVSKPIGTRMLQVPVKAYVEVVYRGGDFGLIFGGPPVVAARLPQNVPLKNLSKEVQQIVGTEVLPFDGDPDE